jgi:rare lipoprotein A
MKKNYCILLLLLLVCLTGSGQSATATLKTEQGRASYYSDKLAGRKTSSGERYNIAKLTAAHKTLPFGTLVKVTNLSNGKSVIVKINDRGPMIKGRIIDVSKKAAQTLGMIKAGIANVKLEYPVAQPKS